MKTKKQLLEENKSWEKLYTTMNEKWFNTYINNSEEWKDLCDKINKENMIFCFFMSIVCFILGIILGYYI